MSRPREEEDQSQSLLERWHKVGDVDALDALLRAEIDGLARRLRARGVGTIGTSMSSTDLTQEAVLRLLRLDAPPSFENPAALSAFLWKAAWRLLVNRAQRPGRALVRLSADDSRALSSILGRTSCIVALGPDDQRTALEVVVNLLMDEDREALGLVHFQGLSVDEAARRLGLTRGAVDVRLVRSRRKLAQRLVEWAIVVG